ncbi:type VI secretion system Vgr family protein [Chitinophagaceae bacterium MMS25-I14]
MFEQNGSASPGGDAAAIISNITGVIHAVGLQIVIGGAVYLHYHSFSLQQSVSGHHTFTLVLAHDILQQAQDHNMEESRDFLGQTISITFNYRNLPGGSPERRFKGIITKVGFTQEHGSSGRIVLNGYSPAALLDSAPHTQSFTGISLQSLAAEIIKQGVSEQQMTAAVKTAYTDTLPYTCQYNESHYNYLARMAAAYGEWFYYDGETLYFGKPALPDPIRLIYGRDARQVQVQMKSAHVNRQHYGYNSNSHTPLSGGDTSVTGLGELGMHAYDISQNLYKAPSLQVAPIRAASDQDVEATQKGAAGAAAATMFTVTGSTSIPFLYPGCLIELNFRKPESSEAKYFSRMLVTSINHHVDARGDYHGHFEAIPSDTPNLPEPFYIMPVAEPQVATVTDNSDGQGRVKVQFDWQSNGETTDFIRMMAPDAGSSDAVGKNRGYVAIPEVGDQVMIGFVHHHPDRPFVMGGMFHGLVGAGGGAENHIKSITTRSGHTIELDDAGTGTSITIKDPGGNVIHLDTIGQNITITAPETMTLNCRNMIINADENVSINAGENVTTVAGMNITESAGLDITQSAGDCMSHFAVNDLKVVATNISNIASENVEHHAKTIEKTAEEMKVESTKEAMTINSAKTVELRSAKKSKLY